MEALILRRSYPVPVTFADLRRARCDPDFTPPWELAFAVGIGNGKRRAAKFRRRTNSKTVSRWWSASLKSATGATDDVYAVVDGRETFVGRVWSRDSGHADNVRESTLNTLLEKADEQGYWERPHEVRLDLRARDAVDAASTLGV